MKSVTRKRYTPEFKAQAVGLVGLGKPVQEAAADLGIGTSILYGWSAMERSLRRENSNLKLENDILKRLPSSSAPNPSRQPRDD